MHKKFDELEVAFAGGLKTEAMTSFVYLNSLPKVIECEFAASDRSVIVLSFVAQLHYSVYSYVVERAGISSKGLVAMIRRAASSLSWLCRVVLCILNLQPVTDQCASECATLYTECATLHN